MYLPVVELEEQHLRTLFPDYADYARAVPKLIPRIVSARAAKHFDGACIAAIASTRRSPDSWREWQCWRGRRSGEASELSKGKPWPA